MAANRRYEIGAVDLHRGAEEVAHERAERWFVEQQAAVQEKSFLQRAWHAVGVQNLFREVYRQRELGRARQDILRAKNWYAATDEGRAQQRAAEDALVDHLLRLEGKKEGAERGDEFRAQVEDEATIQAVKECIFSAVEQPATTRESFEVQMNEIAQKVFAQKKQQTSWVATNAWEVVEGLRAERQHTGGLERANVDIALTVGRLRTAARTEVERTAVDGMLEKLNGRHGLASALVNETTVAMSLAAVTSGISLAGRSLAGKAALMVGGLLGASAVSAGIAAYKEGRRLDRERWLHAREHAAGQEDEARLSGEDEESEEMRVLRATRRATLERERAELRPWNVLRRRQIEGELAQLDHAASRNDRRNELQQTLVETASVQEALRFLVDAKSAPEDDWKNSTWRQQVQRQLTDLDAREEASMTIRRDFFRYQKDQPIPVQRRDLFVARAEVRALLQQYAEDGRSWRSTYTADVKQARARFVVMAEGADEKYATYRATVQQLTGRKAALSGLLVGTVVQTAIGALSERVTSPLEALGRYVQSWWTGGGKEGVPTEEVQHQLAQAAQHAQQTTAPTPAEVAPIVVEPPQPPRPETTHIVRDVYYTNSTRAVAEQNELRLAWGGDRGRTTLPSGEAAYVLDISQMIDQGAAIKNGKALILLVPQASVREQAVALTVGPEGRVVIPATSAAGQMFAIEKGQVVFKGFRVEAAVRLTEKEGVQHVGVLASFAGDQSWKPGVLIEEAKRTAPAVSTPAASMAQEVPAPRHLSEEPESSSSVRKERVVTDMPYAVPLQERNALRQARVRPQSPTEEEVPALRPPATPTIAPPQMINDEVENLATVAASSELLRHSGRVRAERKAIRAKAEAAGVTKNSEQSTAEKN